MKWQQLILTFIATICLIFAGNALAQTDININNTNLIRFGGSVTVPENQVVENAVAFGGSVTVSPNARVLAHIPHPKLSQREITEKKQGRKNKNRHLKPKKRFEQS